MSDEYGQTKNAELLAIREAVKESIVTSTLEGTVTAWNSAAERMFGYRPDEVVGKSIKTIVPEDGWKHQDQLMIRSRRGERTDVITIVASLASLVNRRPAEG